MKSRRHIGEFVDVAMPSLGQIHAKPRDSPAANDNFKLITKALG